MPARLVSKVKDSVRQSAGEDKSTGLDAAGSAKPTQGILSKTFIYATADESSEPNYLRKKFARERARLRREAKEEERLRLEAAEKVAKRHIGSK